MGDRPRRLRRGNIRSGFERKQFEQSTFFKAVRHSRNISTQNTAER
jgi:hypothetical protein